MTNTERVAYIRGLTEGLELDADKKEVKVINAIVDLLDDMALSLSELKEGCDDIADQLDAVDEDLGSLENDFYGDDEDGDDDDDDDLDDDDCYYEVTCPACKETICLSKDIVSDGQIDCPSCGKSLEFDLDNLVEEDDGCGCSECAHSSDSDGKDEK